MKIDKQKAIIMATSGAMFALLNALKQSQEIKQEIQEKFDYDVLVKATLVGFLVGIFLAYTHTSQRATFQKFVAIANVYQTWQNGGDIDVVATLFDILAKFKQ